MSKTGTYRQKKKVSLPLWTLASGIIVVFGIAYFTGLFKILPVGFSSSGSGEIQLIDATGESGLTSYRRAPIYDANPSYIETMGGGVAVGDVDGDGWEDLFFTGMPSFNPSPDSNDSFSQSALYLNQGDGTFRDITPEAGLGEIKGFPMGALFFDYDNNGSQDLYVAAYQGGQLFRNEGGKFIDITGEAGVSTKGLCRDSECLGATAAAADYDRDGYLDLLIVNNASWEMDNPAHYGEGSLTPFAYDGQPSFLFRNTGNGTFENVTDETGITNRDEASHREDGKGLQAIWSDFNNDSWPDLYIANDMSPNRLYINSGKGNFIEMGASAYVDELKSSMGIDAADYDLSGYMDLTVTNLKRAMITLFRNYGNLRFDYATFHTGIMQSARSSGWGILFEDLNLDGYEDLVMGSGPIWSQYDESENIFYKNMGNGKFVDVNESVVTFPNDNLTRGVAVIDFDGSGKPDLIFSNIDGSTPQLLKNGTSGNNWLKIDLEGVVSNRDAVGARVTLEREDGLVQSQIIVAGNSYLSTSSKSLFFGLGKSGVSTLTIQWPSGRTDTLKTLEANQMYHIREGENLESPVRITSVRPDQIH